MGTFDKEDSPIFQSLREFGFTCLGFCQGLRVSEISLSCLLKATD